jgi:hypothetical protein
MPSTSRRFVVPIAPAAFASVVALASAASAAEGSLAVRPGDTIRGTLQRCLDRQVAEIELLKGETFRMRVRSTHADNESILLRVLDPDGFNVSPEANVRLVGGEVVAGPFRATQSGTWRFEISTLTAHGAQYEAVTSIRRTRGSAATFGGRRPGAVVAAAAGATIRLRGRDVPAVSLRSPGDTAAAVFAPGSATMAALLGEGLAAPTSGTYELGIAAGTGRVRVTVAPPRRTETTVVEFPALPQDAHSVASWQGPAGWFVDPTRTAPDAQGEAPPPPPPVPTTSPFSGSILDDCPAAGDAVPELGLGDADSFLGPASGVGLPAAGIPRLEDVVRDGRVETPSSGPVYVLTRSSSALGDVTTRVWFLVDGRPSYAPLSLDGRVTLRWQDTGGSQQIQGTWHLAFDPVRGVQVLDGVESRTADGVRTAASAAQGFALPTAPGAWPQGRLTLAFADPRLGVGFTRSETFTGGAAVTVNVARADGSSVQVVHDFPAR